MISVSKTLLWLSCDNYEKHKRAQTSWKAIAIIHAGDDGDLNLVTGVLGKKKDLKYIIKIVKSIFTMALTRRERCCG